MSTFTAEKSETNTSVNIQDVNIIKVDDLDIKNVIFTTPKLGKNKKLNAAIIDSKFSGVYLETTVLLTVFALSYYGNDGTKEIKEEDRQWSLLLKPSKNYEYEKFYSFLRLLNDKGLDWGVEHSPLIFNKKKLNKEKVELLFTSGFKQNIGKDGTVYPEQISVKIMKDKDTFKPNLLVFKDSLKPISLDSFEELQNILPANSLIQLIIQPQVSFNSSGSFGINFKALQILVLDSKKPSRPKSYAFSTLPDEIFKKSSNEETNEKETNEKETDKKVSDIIEENTKDSEENSDYDVEINDD